MPKISALTSLAQASVDTAADVLPIVDATAPATTKKVTVQALVNAGLAAAAPQGGTLALTGALTVSGTISATSVTTAGSVQLNNAQYVQGKNLAGTTTRMLGINSGNTVYIGSVDTTDVTSLNINLSGVDRVTVGTAGMTIAGDVTTAGGAVLHKTTAALTNGAGAGVGTLTNAPAAGNPTKWVAINDGGVTRYIPTW